MTVSVANGAAATDLLISGDIGGGGGGINKTGDGTLTLSSTGNTYTGATTVSAGSLIVTGSLTSAVSVNGTSILGGGGTVGALAFSGTSFFDIALALGGDSLDFNRPISFSNRAAAFGIDNLVYNGLLG